MIADRRRFSLLIRSILLLLALQALAPIAGPLPPSGSLRNDGVALAALAPDGTSRTGTPIIITGAAVQADSNPSGEQVLRLAGPVEGPDSLDPALSRDLGSAFLVRQVFRGLTAFDHDLQPVPELAERIEISPDGRDYTFSLRPEATFQSGRPISAQDVVVSLTRALDPRTTGGDAAPLGGPTFLSDIDGAAALIAGETDSLRGVQAVDDQTVQIHLDEPRATFLMKLAAVPASIVDAEEVGNGGDWWRTPNGSGPFRVSEWQPEDHMTLARFDGYFAGPPVLERVEIALGPNALQSFNLYQADEVDIDSVSVSSLDRVLAPESGLGDEVTITPLFAVDYIAFRADVAPLDDPHIREAIQLGFPRTKVARVTYEGYVEEATGLIPSGMLGQDWPVDLPTYDREAARAAIAASRYGSADQVPPIRIYVSGGGAAEALRDSVERSLGLRVEVISLDLQEFLTALARKELPAYELYWGADYPDPETFLWTLFGSDSADNYINYRNRAMDELLRKAASELDPAARASLYAEAQRLLMADQVVIPIYFDVAYSIAKPYVKGLNVTPLGILRLETIWLEH
jgi:peptide/nickel transport system substrate-binding protein/oligopeptide transport system substrate-binding protein